MHSFQHELEDYLTRKKISYESNVDSFTTLDFKIYSKSRGKYILAELKEKKQHYNIHNWPSVNIEEHNLFIFDDLSARKILKEAPLSCLLIRDFTTSKYHFMSVVDLFLMPKIRVNRPIEKNKMVVKGKWFVDLRNSFSSTKLPIIFNQILKYLDGQDEIFKTKIECYGKYFGETIFTGGILRRPDHWNKDVDEAK
ncbi:MAG: hypothetical protein ACYC3H_08375 [Bellilinea sp.]